MATIRQVRNSDVSAVRILVNACPPLTLHTAVTYGVLFNQFANLCFLAEDVGGLGFPVGYVSSLRGTVEPECVYVWQLGVLPSYRGQGLSFKLLDSVITAASSIGCTRLKVGIEPSNEVSLHLFRSYAGKRGLGLTQAGRVDFDDHLTTTSEYDVIWEMPMSDFGGEEA